MSARLSSTTVRSKFAGRSHSRSRSREPASPVTSLQRSITSGASNSSIVLSLSAFAVARTEGSSGSIVPGK